MNPNEPLLVDGDPEQVRERIVQSAVQIRDLWFPTRREMDLWQQASSPVYVRWIGSHAFEIGPRLPTMPAARLCPVFRGQLRANGAGRTTITVRLRMLRMTRTLLWLWTLALVGWAMWLLPRMASGEEPVTWLIAWVGLLVCTHGGSWVAWQYGRKTLLQALPWVTEVVSHPLVVEDDWG